MQVNSISETQPQFKGLINLKNVKVDEGMITKAISAEGISLQKLEAAAGNAYKTLLTTANGENFKLNIPFDKVLEAYTEVAFTNKVIDLDCNNYKEVSSFLFG